MKIAVVGAGAVGGIIAWHLAKAGHDPLVVARPATAAILQTKGLTLSGAGAGGTVMLRATDDATRAGVQDLVLVGFKAHDWPAGLTLVTPLIGPDTVVVPLLNGIPWWYLDGLGGQFGDIRLESVDPSGEIGRAVPTRHILGCVVYVGANRSAPDQINWNGRRRLILGEPSGAMSPRLGEVVGLLSRIGLEAEATGKIRWEVWLKLLGNACFNPVSAITGATIDIMSGDPAVRQVLRAMMLECVAVARAVGITDLPDVEMRLVVHPSMVGVKTSMLQDREAGRPLELGALVDAVTELGRTGVPTPMLETASALARAAFRQAWPGMG
jgi:2-dehydropantoate 2-reductase